MSRPSRGGLRVRVAATVTALAVAGLAAARLASAAFDEAPVAIGNVASTDGVVSGTVRMTGDRLVIYSGDRFQSNGSSIALNFARGGSLILCPHSHLQVLAANQHAGVMFAFQEGGVQQPFQLHADDVVMTPDWRIQMAGNMPEGETGTLQLSTSRRGELCLSSNAKQGGFFRISELAGDSVYDLPSQSSIRIAGGDIENAPGGCSCEGVTSGPPSPGPNGSRADSTEPNGPDASGVAAPGGTAFGVEAAPPNGAETITPKGLRQARRPQDVSGFVRSFVHLLFGR